MLQVQAATAQPLAATPPMGWNNCAPYGSSVREDQVKGNADFMAAHLKQYGWEYVVVDMEWFVSKPSSPGCAMPGELYLDEYGRYLSSVCEFPSAAGGKGFKPLADYIHAKGLKFGIHIMWGISRAAVEKKLPIEGSSLNAADVADKSSSCPWYGLTDKKTYGVHAAVKGSQDWYDSLLRQYAGWGVDFIKVDDWSYPYHATEIEQIRAAINKCGREILLSLSPGPTPIAFAEHVKANANMWRISPDLFDHWKTPEKDCARFPGQ
jgi:hypothetical protein